MGVRFRSTVDVLFIIEGSVDKEEVVRVIVGLLEEGMGIGIVK